MRLENRAAAAASQSHRHVDRLPIPPVYPPRTAPRRVLPPNPPLGGVTRGPSTATCALRVRQAIKSETLTQALSGSSSGAAELPLTEPRMAARDTRDASDSRRRQGPPRRDVHHRYRARRELYSAARLRGTSHHRSNYVCPTAHRSIIGTVPTPNSAAKNATIPPPRHATASTEILPSVMVGPGSGADRAFRPYRHYILGVLRTPGPSRRDQETDMVQPPTRGSDPDEPA